MLSLKFLRYKGFEMELVTPQEAVDQEINAIISYPQRSPHSFQWFRDNTEFEYTDLDFEIPVDKHSELLERVTIISSDESNRKTTPGLPGVRLTAQARQRIERAVKST
jgi:hypothetical protein